MMNQLPYGVIQCTRLTLSRTLVQGNTLAVQLVVINKYTKVWLFDNMDAPYYMIMVAGCGHLMSSFLRFVPLFPCVLGLAPEAMKGRR